MSWLRTWYWHTFVRPMPVVYGEPPDTVFRAHWAGIYGLRIGPLFIGVIRRWPERALRSTP